MKEITTAQELHGILIELGEVFHRICMKHHLTYYMLGGTMLGAIRHKGFIPWDDDMDFGMPRADYERLKQLLAAEIPPQYEVLTVESSDALLINIIKICDRRTGMKEKYKEHLQEDFGINIDIFPLDNSLTGLHRLRLIKQVLKVSGYRFLSTKSRPLHKKCVAWMLKVALCWTNKLMYVRLIEKHLFKGGEGYVSNIYGAWGERETVPAEVMGTPVLYPFEDKLFYGVAKPHDYLKSLYGDYMKLPPENKRHIHVTGCYWK